MRQIPDQQGGAWYPQPPVATVPRRRPIFSRRDRLILLGLAFLGLLGLGVPLLVRPLLPSFGTLLTGTTLGGRYDAFDRDFGARAFTADTAQYTANIHGQAVALAALFLEGADSSDHAWSLSILPADAGTVWDAAIAESVASAFLPPDAVFQHEQVTAFDGTVRVYHSADLGASFRPDGFVDVSHDGAATDPGTFVVACATPHGAICYLAIGLPLDVERPYADDTQIAALEALPAFTLTYPGATVLRHRAAPDRKLLNGSVPADISASYGLPASAADGVTADAIAWWYDTQLPAQGWQQENLATSAPQNDIWYNGPATLRFTFEKTPLDLDLLASFPDVNPYDYALVYSINITEES